MRLLVLHLTDLHFDGEGDNRAITRYRELAAACCGSIPGLTHLLVVITGDLVEKGQAGGFEWARTMLSEFRDAAKAFSPLIESVDFVVVPGNHDTVRPAAEVEAFAWEKAREDLLRNPLAAPNATAASIRVQHQEDFFSFESAMCGTLPRSGLARLSWKVNFDYPDIPVEVLCLNTSWMCKDQNDYGRLLASLPASHHSPGDNTLKIVAMHHPWAWLQRDNARAVERLLYPYADIILSGHEHTAEKFVKHTLGRAENAYFEGDAFSGPHGGFAAIVYEPTTKQRKTYSFCWQVDGYAELGQRDWAPMRRGLGGPADGFLLTPKFEDFLESAGLVLPEGSPPIRLEDIFVYPKLRDITLELKAIVGGPGAPPSKKVSSDVMARAAVKSAGTPKVSLGAVRSAADVVGNIEHESHVLILGEARSGKSALLRRYYQELRGKGLVPLLIKPEDCRVSNIDKLHQALLERAKEQYDDDGGRRYASVPLSRRVLLLDELHSLDFTNAQLKTLFENLGKLASKVIVTTDELYLIRQAFAAVDAMELLDYKILRLLELNPHQRRELTVKLHVATGAVHDSEAFASINNLDDGVTAVIGASFVTPYAGEVKEIARQLLFDPQGTGGHGAYGFYYDAQIKGDLRTALRGLSKERAEPLAGALDAWLAALAMRMHRTKTFIVSEPDIDELIEEFRLQKVPINRDALISVLLTSRLITSREGGYCFRERYQRLYYLARFLEDMLLDDLTRDEAQGILQEFVDSIDQRESADVILFTVYLTKNSWLLQRLVESAQAVFDEEPECDMSTAYDFAYSSNQSLAVLNSKLPVDCDDDEGDGKPAILPALPKSIEPSTLEEKVSTTLRRMSGAFNILNILGLAVRNYPLRIPLHLREQMVSNGYSLGLRSLSAFLSLLKDGKGEFATLTRRYLKVEPGAAEPSLITAHLASICSFGVVRRISQAFASPHLELLLADIWEDDDRVNAKIVKTSVLLPLRGTDPNLKGLKEELSKNPIAAIVLTYVVANYLRTYRVTNERRLKLCNAVGLDPNVAEYYYDPVRPRSLSGQLGSLR